MIKIELLKILNYRSFKNEKNQVKDLTLLNIMVGKNNVGKTNVLRAIYLFFNPESYNAVYDRNMIKVITGGAGQDPSIRIKVTDDEIIKGEIHEYSIVCNLNKSPDYYNIRNSKSSVKEKFSNSKSIASYLEKKFKCVYLSTTDEDMSLQSEKLVNDMILQYFQNKSTLVKETISEFEDKYKLLVTSLEKSIKDIEKDLGDQFGILHDIGLNINPKLEITSKKKISDFLLENIDLKLDDTYAHSIGNKGAGIQRASIILLSLFLLDEIYSKKNKIILLDEPEAFLYPLLIKKIKDIIEDKANIEHQFQMFLTTHSRDFLGEINNIDYNFINITQEREKKEYKRSKNDFDFNKYSVLNYFSSKTKYEVLKNYGLLDDIDDYEEVIICEGPTDKNYIIKMLKDQSLYPQIRYGKHSDGLSGECGPILDYNYLGKGATAVLPILIYLEHISSIKRKVFVLLDGDDEGKKVAKKIKPNEFKNLDIFVEVLPDGLEIEDVVFKKNDYVRGVLKISQELKDLESDFNDVITRVNDKESLIVQTENYIKLKRLNSTGINNIKHKLSVDLEEVDLKTDWLLEKMKTFFSY